MTVRLSPCTNVHTVPLTSPAPYSMCSGSGRVCGVGGGGVMHVGNSWRWHLSRAMRLTLHWCRPCRLKTGGRGRGGQPQPSGGLRELWSYSTLLLRSLYFNSLTNSDTLLDCAFEPVYWTVDNVTRWFGVAFVTLVILLTTSVVVIVYLYVLPTIVSNYATPWIVWHLCCGHWLLVMVVFHYYKATTTSPGHPPKDNIHIPSVSICKKCINPKPARTHHCSICNTCVLKMDHHCRILVTSIACKSILVSTYLTLTHTHTTASCVELNTRAAWLNNCVGHFNHRYFFSFCIYMTLGCIYCSVSSRDMFLEAYNAVESYYQTPPLPYTSTETTAHKSIIFLWVLTSSVAIALGGLTLWHAVLIVRGETSVERHINRKERKRLKEQGKAFKNPYHHGKMDNWKRVFGVEIHRHWLTRVLLPSSHLPKGDGIIWDCTFTRKDPMAI
ncbi:palmitoyltransferase ZDHHC16B isoform X2 [Syngnathoides biaculeatus]|uniref:palmitoyltransferase ZDHHC16B isoform X2 n=1 Tax=Syngnathoides biaculeatus TaxID=300417 RepID=UPI002ADE1A16|nr:palmitoyltransferase ZDHHC16B isoform X2 [Syngnathoides biaculeatus]